VIGHHNDSSGYKFTPHMRACLRATTLSNAFAGRSENLR